MIISNISKFLAVTLLAGATYNAVAAVYALLWLQRPHLCLVWQRAHPAAFGPHGASAALSMQELPT